MTKRAFDVVVSGLVLIVAAPIVVVAACAIWVTTRDSPIFRQTRVGRDFRPFQILKLRTMRRDEDGALITAGGDPRLTRIGAMLRRTKLDEIPQLVNVLKGDMSLVGPRPEVPLYVDRFRDDYAVILEVRPGITDRASLKYRNEAELLAAAPDPEALYVDRILPDKIRLAKQYVAGRSMREDLGILWATARVVFARSTSAGPTSGM